MSFSTNSINPKPCNYGCGTRIYWNTVENAYFEVFTKTKHICKNRNNNNNNNVSKSSPSTYIPKPNYYKKSFYSKEPNPKMCHSLELLQGSILDVQKKYESLSDIIRDYNGKVHGSQRDRDPMTKEIDLLVYYEVPEGKREEVKQKFNTTIRNPMILQGN